MRRRSSHISPHDVAPEHARAARVGEEQGDEDAEKRRLAAAVRADEAEQLSVLHLERHVVQRDDAFVALDEMLGDDRGAHRDAVAVVSCTSAGMPILSTPPRFGTLIFTA